MAWWRWEQGRQGTGYEKLLLLTARCPVAFDVYILRYRCGAFAPPHVDVAVGGRHYRLNVLLWAAAAGGDFVCDGATRRGARLVLFRPDRDSHSVSRVERGTRYVLSIGWVRP